LSLRRDMEPPASQIASRHLCPEPCGVVSGPFEEGPWRCASNVRTRGCHKRRLTDGRSPGAEQRVHEGRRTQDREQLRPRGVWRDLLDAQGPSDRASDGVHLLGLRQRLWPGHNILRASVPIFAQRADRDRGQVTLVGRRRWGVEIRPAHDVTGANLRPPEMPRVSCEHAGPQECPLQSGHASISRSMRSTMSLEGLGCWKNGCGVLRGAVRNTIRRAWSAIRFSALGAAVGGATHTRKTVSTSCRHRSRVSGTVRSPRTTSTCGGRPVASGLRAITRNRAPVPRN
jgi:hypothetical protein